MLCVSISNQFQIQRYNIYHEQGKHSLKQGKTIYELRKMSLKQLVINFKHKNIADNEQGKH